jgi:hypothetical protein
MTIDLNAIQARRLHARQLSFDRPTNHDNNISHSINSSTIHRQKATATTSQPQSLCLFAPVLIFSNSLCGIPAAVLLNPPNTSATIELSISLRIGAAIKAFVSIKLDATKCPPKTSSTCPSTSSRNSPSSPLAQSNTLFTNPHASNSPAGTLRLVSNASFAFPIPIRRTKPTDAPPSAIRPRLENGVRRYVCGTQ